MNPPVEQSLTWLGRIGRVFTAVGITGLFVVFLVVSQWLGDEEEVLTLRSVEGIDPVSMPAPPPPPPQTESQPTPPPPPPQTMELPMLDLSVNDTAPPVKAVMQENNLEIMMKPADFTPAQQMKARCLYASTDLDGQPRLLNRPSVTFPASRKRSGDAEGKVTLEVLINAVGRVTIRRVISSSHPDFIPMAKAFAERARFSPPKKDGRVVNAVFNWPLVLRP
ncbi:MAG: TonB family protein [Verrucomicrobiales bacterium]|nr:TonB family protein [Verrucomicrobiales bacterium]